MNSESGHARHVLSLREAACERLLQLEAFHWQGQQLDVALPRSYAGKRRHYPLLLLLGGEDILGASIETSRLLAEASDITESILVSLPALPATDPTPGLALARLLPALAAAYRCMPQATLVYARGTQAAQLLASLPQAEACVFDLLLDQPDALPVPARSQTARTLWLNPGAEPTRAQALRAQITQQPQLRLHELPGDEADSALPTLVRGLRACWPSGKQYGDAVVPMRKPLVSALFCALAPLLGRLTRKPPLAVRHAQRFRWHSKELARDFEVFVVLPPAARGAAPRACPALVVMDANIEFSTVAEIAARLAAQQQIEAPIVIGIGTPRAEGSLAFALRRFEELAPPSDHYDFGDDLGRIFRALFALRGQDARRCMGRAPDLLRFITNEVLPQLGSCLPIDNSRLGLLGHSAAGTFVGYALSQAASPFRHYIGVSPGIAISNNWLLQHPQAGRPARSAYFAVGSEEMSNAFNIIAGIPRTAEYAQALRSHGSDPVHDEVLAGESHASVFARAVTRGLLAAYGAHGARTPGTAR